MKPEDQIARAVKDTTGGRGYTDRQLDRVRHVIKPVSPWIVIVLLVSAAAFFALGYWLHRCP